PASRTLIGRTSTPSDGAEACMAPNWPGPAGAVGFCRNATRFTPGAISFRSSSHLAPMPYSYSMKPVALPAGRARGSTKPAPTGSATCTNTIGTARVACSSGPVVVLLTARMTSGTSAINSAAYLRMRSRSPAPQRMSMRALRPSIQPDCASACANARRPLCSAESSDAKGESTPMRRMRSVCCARADSGQAAAAPPMSDMNSRRFTPVSPVLPPKDNTPGQDWRLLHCGISVRSMSALESLAEHLAGALPTVGATVQHVARHRLSGAHAGAANTHLREAVHGAEDRDRPAHAGLNQAHRHADQRFGR